MKHIKKEHLNASYGTVVNVALKKHPTKEIDGHIDDRFMAYGTAADEIKENIHQPFFTTKKGTAETGPGLLITNDIIKTHGGKMVIKSIPGESSTFTIYTEKRGYDGF